MLLLLLLLLLLLFKLGPPCPPPMFRGGPACTPIPANWAITSPYECDAFPLYPILKKNKTGTSQVGAIS